MSKSAHWSFPPPNKRSFTRTALTEKVRAVFLRTTVVIPAEACNPSGGARLRPAGCAAARHFVGQVRQVRQVGQIWCAAVVQFPVGQSVHPRDCRKWSVCTPAKTHRFCAQPQFVYLNNWRHTDFTEIVLTACKPLKTHKKQKNHIFQS